MSIYLEGEVDVFRLACGSEYETITHLLLDCVARDFWRKSPLCIDNQDQKELDFGAWCHGFLEGIGEEECGLFMTLL